MTTQQQRLAYVSLWVKQDLDDSSPVIATGKLNPVDKSLPPCNVTLFRNKETGKSTMKVSRKDEGGNWVTYGTLEVEQKVKGNMVAYAKGLLFNENVVVFLFDNSEKQQTNSKAPDYSGSVSVDEKQESRVVPSSNKPIF
jgi:hypothetical protein